MSKDIPELPRVQAAERRRAFRLLLSESSVDPAYDPYGVLDQEPAREDTVRTCGTVGELIRENFLYLLDRGELGTLRNLLEECAEVYDEMPLPPEDRP